jgi:glycine/sarcosine N-methyltransferase
VDEGRAYDRLAADYHKIFPDWRETVDRQGRALDRLIRAEVGNRRLVVLDCSSGIGTQAIGLALRGHRVVASDISAAALRRAAREARARGARLTTVQADIRDLATAITDRFDVVLSCDNSISHFLTTRDLRAAIGAMRDRVKPGGLLLVSLRDYRRDAGGRPSTTLPHVFGKPGRRRVVFQVWHWQSRLVYRPDLAFMEENMADWKLHVYHLPPLRAWTRGPIVNHLERAGLLDVRWRLPADTGYYQPIATGRLAKDKPWPPGRAPRR